MKIHVSDPCKLLLDDRYVLVERTEGQELSQKVSRIIFTSLLDINIYIHNSLHIINHSFYSILRLEG